MCGMLLFDVTEPVVVCSVRGIRVSTWYAHETTQEAFSFLRYAFASVRVCACAAVKCVELARCKQHVLQATELHYLPHLLDETDLHKKAIGVSLTGYADVFFWAIRSA
jgi:hypothetical protein